MKKSALVYTTIFSMFLFASCSVSKFIPEKKYLLDEVKIETDKKELKPALFNNYIRQNPNAKWFNIVKIPMYIYSASGRDSTKAINKFFRKIGDAPVIYDEATAIKTKDEMQKAARNFGYMGATVNMEKKVNKNKLKLTYKIISGHPYYIRQIAYDIKDLKIGELISGSQEQSLIKEGMLFDVNVLNSERDRINKLLQDNGYYKFTKDFIVYQADTTRNINQIDLTMRLLPYQKRKEDAPTDHSQYKVNSVNFVADDNIPRIDESTLSSYDSIQYKGRNIYFKENCYLRPKVMNNANRIKEDGLFNDQDVRNTYYSLGRLNALKYSNIRFLENDSLPNSLDAYILMARANNKSLSFELEGTNSAGDIGAAASVAFMHKNLFRGSESFMIKLRGAYEAITGLKGGYASDNYTEYGIESNLNFPEFMFPFLSSSFKNKIRATSELGIKFSSQIRPEFSRTSASASWSYRWSRLRNIHRFDLIDINYIYMPKISDEFRDYLDNMTGSNSLLKYSYEDQLIVKMGYNYTFNSLGTSVNKNPTKDSYTIRFSFEEAGNLLYAASKLANVAPKNNESFVLANIPFAQYVKADVDYTKNFVIDPRNSLVFHIGGGIAVPYGNSKMLPFEKRYFSGGANSVRGWTVRSLGPGAFQGSTDGKLDFLNYTGDIKLDVNLEYRTHLFWKFNGAAFVDAGNIWNMKENSDQPGGVFKINKFYNQIAVAYGLGIRMDLDYLILRFDGGMKAINPMRTGKEKYPITRPDFGRDFAFHFAVGYPF